MFAPLQSTDLHVVLTNHLALLDHAMAEQLGPVAALIARTLGRNGPLSLRDAITAIQQDAFLAAQIHDDNSRRLLPRAGVSSAQSSRPASAASSAAVGDDGARGDVTASPAPPTGAHSVPLLNATAAYVRAARETPSNLFLDTPTGPAASPDTPAAPADDAGLTVVRALVNDPSLLTDASVKETMARLVLHRIVRFDAAHRTYELMLGYGVLLRVLFPLVTRLARRQFGAAGEAIVLVLHRLAVVPSWSAVLQLALDGGASEGQAQGLPRSVSAPAPAEGLDKDGSGRASFSRQELHHAGVGLLRAGWVQFLATSETGESVVTQNSATLASLGSPSSGRKRPRSDFDFDVSETTTTAVDGGAAETERPCRLCLQAVLSDLYEDAIEQLMVQYYGSHLTMPSTIVSVLLQHSLPRHHPPRHHHHHHHQRPLDITSTGDEEEVETLFHNADDLALAPVRPGGFPPAPVPARTSAAAAASRPPEDHRHDRSLTHAMTLSEIAAGVGQHAQGPAAASTEASRGTDEAALSWTLRRLCEHTPAAVRAPLVATVPAPATAHHAGSHSPPRYALVIEATGDALKAAACESVIFARHGVLGVRLWKLLTAYHALEDRTLAEECMSTQAKTREALHALLKDGYVAQREVPRNALQPSVWLAERVPRNFVFLWSTSMAQQVVPIVREQVAKTLHHALSRLAIVASARTSTTTTTTGAQGMSGSAAAAAGSMGSLHAALRAPASAEMSASLQNASDARGVNTPSLHVNDALKTQRALVGLQACALSLMQQLLVLDFF